MSVLYDFIDWLFSFILMVLAVWLLIIATPLINEMRKESQDPEIAESWHDVRVAIKFTYQGTKERLIERLRRTK